MKKISILSCGWLGMPLAKHLSHKGYNVKGSTTTPEKLKHIEETGSKAYQIKLGNGFDHNWSDFLDCDVLIVCIPPSANKEDSQLPLEQVALAAENKSVKKILYTSATSVYPRNGKLVTEADATYIKSPHSGVEMLRLEEVFSKNKHFESCILRFAGLFGGDRKPGRFFAGKKGLNNGAHPINMIHLEDCIQIIERIIEIDRFSQVFNACADEHPSRAEFYDVATKKQGFDSPEFTDINDKNYRIVSSEKLKEVLNYKFIYSNPIEAL